MNIIDTSGADYADQINTGAQDLGIDTILLIVISIIALLLIIALMI